MQPYRLFQAEEEVHVVDCLAARSLQQVVYHRNDKQLVFIFLEIAQALVHLFSVSGSSIYSYLPLVSDPGSCR